jgi:hypothetical protein
MKPELPGGCQIEAILCSVEQLLEYRRAQTSRKVKWARQLDNEREKGKKQYNNKQHCKHMLIIRCN